MRDDSDVIAWLKSQTWPDLRQAAMEATSTAYRHPYGFVVIRTSINHFVNWGVRIHVWPNRREFDQYGVRLGTETQRIHCHGWDIISRTLLGSVIQREYDVVRKGPSAAPYCAYTVTSDRGIGRSTLRRLECGLAATLGVETERASTDDPFIIPRGTFHETCPVPATTWSVTLAATEHVVRNDSLVLMPHNAMVVVQNRREPVLDITSILRDLDGQYSTESGEADRWASFIFLTRRGHILMVRTFRNPTLWQPVGGQASASDLDCRATAIRELEEETGIVVPEQDLVELGERPRDRGFGSIYGWLVETDAEPVLQRSELAEGRWFGLESIASLPMFPATQWFLDVIGRRHRDGMR